MKLLQNNYISKIKFKGNNRTSIVWNNILGSGVLKVINIIITLLVVPMTIDYISADKYGIWLTLSSIIAWVSYFDFGLGHGFRNKFTEALARNDFDLARQLVSTTYTCLSIIFFVILIVILSINRILNWGEILNISQDYNSELTNVFALLAICFCSNCVVNTFNMLLIANQQTAKASLIQTATQIAGLVGITIVTHVTSSSLLWLAIVYSLIPSILLIFISIYAFIFTKYSRYRPSFKLFRKNLVKYIVGLGGKFFIIMLSTLIIFQCINLIITRLLGPLEVTQYNIAYKYFNVTYMAFVIILTPVWTAFTDAYVKRDISWMKRMMRKMEYVSLGMSIIVILMMLCSKFVFKLWIGNNVNISNTTVFMVGLFIMSLNTANTYMFLINGVGKVQLQMYIYIFFAVFSIPLMIIWGREYGIIGIILPSCIACLTQGAVGRIQIIKLISGRATGIWMK